MMLFRYYLLAAFAVIVFWWPLNYLLGCFLYKRRVAKFTKNIPIIDDYPFIGSALRFMGKSNEEMMEQLKSLTLKNQTPFVLWLGPKSFLFVDHPDDISCVMNSKGCIEKSYVYRFFNGGLGFFTASAQVWKRQRKQLAPCYSNQVNWSFLPIFNQKADLFVRNVGQHIGKGLFDVMHYSSECALDIVCESVMGAEMNIQDGENGDYLVALNEWLSTVARRMCNVFLHPDIIYKQTQLHQVSSDWYARSEVLPEKVIVQKSLEYDELNGDIVESEDDDQLIEKPQNLLTRLLKLKSLGAVSDAEIREHVNLVIFAGHDTSAFTIAHTILLLAMHPKVDNLLMDEFKEVFGDQPVDSEMTMEQVNRLVYLEQIIKESLRLFPVVPVLLRHCTEDTKLSNCVIPKGSDVVVSILSVQRRKDIWGMDADEFKPERFSKEASSNRNQYAFMAFSNASRNCLGQRFAYISIKVILAKLFRKYRFSTHLGMEDVKFRLEVTCKPIDGVKVEVEERN